MPPGHRSSKKPGPDRVNVIVFLIVYKTVETNSFLIYEAKVFFGDGKIPYHDTKNKKSNYAVFFLHLTF